MKGSPASERGNGFTLMELILVICFVVILTLLLVPGMARFRARSSRISCANNLKQMGLAFKTWALDNSGRFPMQVSTNEGGAQERVELGALHSVFQVMSNELSTPKILVCPEGTRQPAATNFLNDLQDTKLEYFVGLDTTASRSSAWLCGDRNFTSVPTPPTSLIQLTTNSTLAWDKENHRYKGNLLFGDGSVSGVSNTTLPSIIRSLEHTNRLLVP